MPPAFDRTTNDLTGVRADARETWICAAETGTVGGACGPARLPMNIDCGGLRYVMVGYGNFTQLVIPIGGTGHVSIAFELGANPLQHVEAIARLAR